MHVILCWIASFLLAAPAAGGNGWYVRVVARSDRPAAQAEKLRVRDEVLSCCPKHPDQLPAALSDIRKAARRIAPDAAVTVRPWAPAGRPVRPTLYVALGEAAGRNWWGVLYEDALLLAAQEEDRTEEAQTEEENGGIEFTWPVVDWLLGLMGF